jgi:aminopeptidase
LLILKIGIDDGGGKRYSAPMMDREGLRRYAGLVLGTGLGVGKGTLLRIGGELPHRELMLELAAEAYRRGAAHVRLEYDDVRLARIRVDSSPDGNLDDVSELLKKDAEIFVREGWSMLRIAGYEDASAMEGADHARLTRIQRARSRAVQVLRDAQMASRIPWCVICSPTEAWARTVLGPEGTADGLWQVLVPILRLDAPDPEQSLRGHMAGLVERARLLNGKNLRSLRFQGRGTDLRVALSAESRWLGGGDATPDGRAFFPNIPSEEVFTTPDFRGTEGVVSMTRRARIHGTVVEGARLEFRAGLVTSCSAAQGGEALERFLETDAGARRLGEVALVDSASPIWKSGMVFDTMLLDENAACHIALGAGYDLGFTGTDRSGFNTSFVHEDFMIGSDDVSVTGADAGGAEVPVIVKGRFVI